MWILKVLIQMAISMITNKLSKMKHSYALLLLPLLIVGCSPKIVNIQGTPGTRIMELNGEEIGCIDDSGKATITINDDKYYGMFLSQEPGSTTPVPFAIDYHKTNSYNQQIILPGVISFALLIPSSISFLVSALANQAPSLLAFLGMFSSAGIVLSVPINQNSSQITHCFKYESNQTTNNDLVVSDECNNSKQNNTHIPED